MTYKLKGILTQFNNAPNLIHIKPLLLKFCAREMRCGKMKTDLTKFS